MTAKVEEVRSRASNVTNIVNLTFASGKFLDCLSKAMRTCESENHQTECLRLEEMEP